MPIDDIYPSPENDRIYGEVEHDNQMDDLIESIREHGLEEPLIISLDNYVISGHRRLYACQCLEMESVPVRIKDVWHDDDDEGIDWHRLLASYNPQRQKTAASLLREALMRDTSGEEVFAAAEASRKAKATDKNVEFMVVKGDKKVKPLTARTAEFLAAVKLVINTLREFWPLNLRQIHYNMLNDPPMKQTMLGAPDESYRYRNDQPSYKALGRLLTSARYEGVIPWECMTDETRPCLICAGFDNLDQFVRQETGSYLVGYHRDLQQGQPAHVEFLGEKNTIKNIVAPVCKDFHVTGMFGRGYAGPSVWVDTAQRFRESGKDSMVLVIASDYDPEGLDLADDAVRSLRDKFDIPIEAVRCAIEREQIEDLNLATDFNPAKETSTRFKSFVGRTGGTKTWELEALPPAYLQQCVRDAITSVIDTDIFNAVVEQQKEDCDRLFDLKQEIGTALGI